MKKIDAHIHMHSCDVEKGSFLSCVIRKSTIRKGN